MNAFATIEQPRLARLGATMAAPVPDLVSHEPATGSELWRGQSGDVEDLVARARRAWPGWAGQSLATRIELVRRFANEARKDAEALAELVARETGKPLWEARAEVDCMIARVEIAIRAVAERTAQRRLDGGLQGALAVRHKPHGVMAAISPANMPLQLPAGQVIPALIAGNCVILKPSEKTPATGEALVRLFQRAGIPSAVIGLCQGGPQVGRALAAHDDVDGVIFTGSSQAGLALNRLLAERPDKIAALAMGGNNAMVLWDTPKLADAAAIVVQSAFSSAGQRCTATRRLIVADSMWDRIVPEIATLADRLLAGAPFDDPPPFMGPLIDNAAADKVTDGVLWLLSHGARPIRHLLRPHADLPFLRPALLDVTEMEQRPDVELFGPVLQLVRVADLDAAIAEANRTRYGLAAALVGGSPQDYNRFWANVRAGLVNWNRPTIGPAHGAPVGGVGLSGNHRPGGFYTADSCAYPVSSGEVEQPRAMIGVGLSEAGA